MVEYFGMHEGESLKKETTHHDWVIYLIGAVAATGIVASTYYAITASNQADEIATLLQERNTLLQQNNLKDNELAVASTTIGELNGELTGLRDDLEDLADRYKDEKNRNEDFEDQIRDLAGTLGDLDKLAKTDKELLAKYSKVYFLNENYEPAKLRQIGDKYVLSGKGDLYFLSGVINHLEDLLDAAKKDDLNLKVLSAYRSFDTQSDLKGQYTQVYGTGANAFSADQGYSEHQLGTTVDITTPEVGGAYTSFANTDGYQWLLKNAYKYGFILSYPEGNDFYVYEPWHWRYVGVDLATYLHKKDKTFYEMDQRDIDEYLLTFYD